MPRSRTDFNYSTDTKAPMRQSNESTPPQRNKIPPPQRLCSCKVWDGWRTDKWIQSLFMSINYQTCLSLSSQHPLFFLTSPSEYLVSVEVPLVKEAEEWCKWHMLVVHWIKFICIHLKWTKYCLDSLLPHWPLNCLNKQHNVLIG